MSGWTSVLRSLAVELESRVDAARARVERRFPGDDPLRIAAYRGFGTRNRVYVSGRVLEDERIGAATRGDSRWRNLLNALRRLESDEIPGARVRVELAGAAEELIADEEGYFHGWVEPTVALAADREWHDATLALLAPLREGQAAVAATGPVLVPPDTAAFGVVSDIDDTVLRTGATSVLRMAYATLFENAQTRLPFPGVAAFYRALADGTGTRHDPATAAPACRNPLFFVSSSPWNLYDLLTEFFQVQGIPAGPLLLRDWGLDPAGDAPSHHHEHKLAAIARVLETYPTLPFLLIGDSGQQDPEIYRDVVRAYPGRILAAYVRNVTPHPERSTAIRTLAAEVLEAGSTLVLADDTLTAAGHAAERGWIDPARLEDVRLDKRVDEGAAPVSAPTVVVEGRADEP